MMNRRNINRNNDHHHHHHHHKEIILLLININNEINLFTNKINQVMVTIINNNNNEIIRIEIDQIQVEVIHNSSILINIIITIINNFPLIDSFFNQLLPVLPMYCFSFSFFIINKVTDRLSYERSK